MKSLAYALLLSLLFSASAQAAVWVHDKQRSWNDYWQQQYANWVATRVGPKFFKDLGYPYSQIPLDCADAHYALVAYFARMNQLPFRVNRGGISNLTKSFDHIRDPEERLAAFIRFLRGNYGTESLAHADTYPVGISSVMPGDIFMYKVGSNGNHTRHTYIIKNVNPDGTFDVLYSTQANADLNGPLSRRSTYMFNKAPVNGGVDYGHWGFRRMKPAQYSETDHSRIPGANFEQYELAQRLSAVEFFRAVKRVNQTVSESPQMLLSRHFNGLCSSLVDRIDIVKKGIAHQNRLGGSCMNFQDYDAHSTPSRDSGLKMDYTNYQYDFEDLKSRGDLNRVQSNLAYATQGIFNSRRSESERSQLYSSCPIDFGTSSGQKISTDMGTFRDNLFAGNVSFHPNDNIYRRWGFKSGSKTSCTQYYGYPE